MSRQPRSWSVSKEGVNFVRGVVEERGSLFHEIRGENDRGIDAYVDLLWEESTDVKVVALQIKSGNSYLDEVKGQCKIPVGKHFEYWANYSLPVYGVVYVPTRKNAYWVNIKRFLEEYWYKNDHKFARTIRFWASQKCTFNLPGLTVIGELEGADPDVLPTTYTSEWEEIPILRYVGNDATKLASLLARHGEVKTTGWAVGSPKEGQSAHISFASWKDDESNRLRYTRRPVPHMRWSEDWNKQHFSWHLRLQPGVGVVAISRQSLSPA